MLLSYNADLLPRVRMLGRINYTEPWIHFSRTVNEYVLYVIRDGNMYLQEDGIRYHLKTGDFFLLEPGHCHEGYQRATCNYYYAHFTHPAMAAVADEEAAMAQLAEKRRLSLISYNLDDEDPTDPVTFLPKQFHLPKNESNATLRTALDCYNAREEHYKRRTSAQLHCFLLEVAHEHLLTRGYAQGRTVKKSEIIAEQLIRYLNAHYASPLSSREIEETFEMNFDYMNRVFSRLTGSPIFAYTNMLRIYNAKQLIATTDLPISEIAYLVGIEDRYYFSKLFRRMAGMSPSAYYKEVRNLGNAGK